MYQKWMVITTNGLCEMTAETLSLKAIWDSVSRVKRVSLPCLAEQRFKITWPRASQIDDDKRHQFCS